MQTAARLILLIMVLGIGLFAAPAPQGRPRIFVALYERGSAWDESKGVLQQAGMAEHRQHLLSMGEKRLGAAPFQPVSGDRMVGMVILTSATREEAQTLVDADPIVSQSVMKATVRPWLVDSLKGCF